MLTIQENLTIQMLQCTLAWEQPQQNLERMEEFLEGACPADLLLLPEMFTTGFSMRPELFAEKHQQHTLEWMTALAKHRNIAVTGSMMYRAGDRFTNRLYFVYPDGTAVTYDKKHLFRMGAEQEHYTAGSEKLVIDYKGWRICPLVCYDLRFPVFSRNVEDYDLLLYVANWPARRSHHWRSLLVARAIENQCYVAACNRVGADGNGVDHSGHSMFVDHGGEILQEVADEEKLLTAVFSKEKLLSAREKFPVLLDRDAFRLG